MSVATDDAISCCVAAWRRWSVERALYWTIGIALALSPTVHPWYVLWILPLAALRGGRAWLLLSGTVFMAYWGLDAYRATGSWPEPFFIRVAIHVPFLLLLFTDALIPKRRPGGGGVTEREEPREGGRPEGTAQDQGESRASQR